jgi:hypothetical protein
MSGLNDSDFLSIWESGSRRHPLDRALLALGAGFPESSSESLAAWPIGRRNRALIGLHCRCFGPRLRGIVSCAGCGEKLEVDLDGRVLTGDTPDPGAGETIEVGGQEFRLPGTRELAGVVTEGDPRAAAVRLVEGCRVSAGGHAPWTDGDLEEIGQRMADADPLAEIRVQLRCPECGREGDESLDIVTFLWAEIEARVRRLLSDIHALASAYGWSESEILSMSEGRRAIYLEMVQS